MKMSRIQISVTLQWVTVTYNGTNGGLYFIFWIFRNFYVFKSIMHLKIANLIVTLGRLQIA